MPKSTKLKREDDVVEKVEVEAQDIGKNNVEPKTQDFGA